jgi:predicted Zn finger-like uncharacterized protein
MLISCPQCATTFSVPDAALGTKGRTLKCAKCGHKWFQSPDSGGSFGLDESSMPPPPARPSVPDFNTADAGGRGFDADLDDGLTDLVAESASGRPRFGGDAGLGDLDAAPAAAARAAAAFDLGNDLDEDGSGDMRPHREPIPTMFSGGGSNGRKGGAAGLWILVVLILLAGAGGAGYYMRDRLLALWPQAGALLARVGLQLQAPGTGLQLHQAGAPERMVVNKVDVVLVRGVISNATGKVLPVPPLRLQMLDKNKQVVQQMIELPPVTTLAPGGATSFKFELQHPDPDAESLRLTFVDPHSVPKPAK